MYPSTSGTATSNRHPFQLGFKLAYWIPASPRDIAEDVRGGVRLLSMSSLPKGANFGPDVGFVSDSSFQAFDRPMPSRRSLSFPCSRTSEPAPLMREPTHMERFEEAVPLYLKACEVEGKTEGSRCHAEGEWPSM